MQIAFSASVQGMQRAGEGLAAAATVIANPTPGSARAADPSPAPPNGNDGLTAAQASGDVERAMVDAIQARRAYAANARALEQNADLVRRGA